MTGSSLSINRDDLMTRVHELDTLQPISKNALRLIQLCQESADGTDEILSIIISEPAIAVRVLSVANSPLYGYTRQISSVSHAVVILGIRNITRLAVSFAAGNMYCGSGANQPFRKKLYRHSLGCALIARSLADCEPDCDPDQAFLGGLLHDIGKLAMIQLLPDQYEALQQLGPASQLPELERTQLGISHQEIGGICARRWGLPVNIATVIADHHGRDGQPVASPLSRVVEAANCVAHTIGIGGTLRDPAAETRCRNSLIENLTEESRQQVVESALAEFDVLDQAS